MQRATTSQAIGSVLSAVSVSADAIGKTISAVSKSADMFDNFMVEQLASQEVKREFRISQLSLLAREEAELNLAMHKKEIQNFLIGEGNSALFTEAKKELDSLVPDGKIQKIIAKHFS